MESPNNSSLTKVFKNQSLRNKLLLMLSLFTVLAVANYGIVKYYHSFNKSDSDIVNLAGRQRMLSQKIAFLSEQVVRGNEHAKDELIQAVNIANASLSVLKNGGNFPGSKKTKVIPPSPKEVFGTLLLTEAAWQAYKKNALVIANEPLIIDSVSYEAKTDSAGLVIKKAIRTKKIVNPEVLLAINAIENKAGFMLNSFNDLVIEYVAQSDQKKAGLGYLLLIILAMNITLVGLVVYTLDKFITQPIREMAHWIERLSTGHLNGEVKYKSKDEIGYALKNLAKLDENMIKAVDFASQIGEGDFSSSYEIASNEDELGKALVNMRQKLIEVARKDSKRKWSAEGLTKFGDILRSNQHDLQTLTDDLLAGLINYLQANQGAIYLVNEKNEEDRHLELISIYAWGRKKHIKNRVEIGEGVPGQSWREQDTVYLTEIPHDYVKITSGLGETNPTSILVVPLKVNEGIYGVIEIASLKEFELYQIEFMEKLAENIASTISTVQASDRTKLLLEQTQRQSEITKAQEEEMRQTMEEIQATSEEMERKEREYLNKIAALESDAVEVEELSNEERALILKLRDDEQNENHINTPGRRKAA